MFTFNIAAVDFDVENLLLGQTICCLVTHTQLVLQGCDYARKSSTSVRYRFVKGTVLCLLNLFPLEQNTDGHVSPLPLLLQLLIVVCGNLPSDTNGLVNAFQPSVRRAIGRVSDIIVATLYPQLSPVMIK